jgi:hypothetical protein
LQKFTESIRTSKKDSNGTDKPPSSLSASSGPDTVIEAYHGQILQQDSDEEQEELKDWHHGKLKFRKHIDDKYRMSGAGTGSDGRKGDDYTYVDPRTSNNSA